jgi:molecular chaperone GrpE
MAEESTGPQPEPTVIRDKRRLDPETGELRTEPVTEEGGTVQEPTFDDVPDALPAELATLQSLADGRLEDLQRLNAEFVNYRKRVERDRAVAKDQALAGVAEALLPVLDDVHLARQHGDLTGPFVAIADKLENTLGRIGLVRYGEVGEPFDPAVHEALMHSHSDEYAVATCAQVLQPGYRFGERVLRPARVAVADPQ